MTRRKAVCEGYSNLFDALCKEVNIPSEVVKGYAKGLGYRRGDRFYYQNHAWNTVYFDSSWHLIDATWGSGCVERTPQRWKKVLSKFFFISIINNKHTFIKHPSYRYFDTEPDEFVKSHLPLHPMWQLKSCPVSYQSFEKLTDPASSKDCADQYAFNNHINYYLSLGKGEKLRYMGDQSRLHNAYGNLVKAEFYHNYNKSLNKVLLTPELTTLDTTWKYIKKFLPDNRALHKYNRDTIKFRTALHVKQLKYASDINAKKIDTKINELEGASKSLLSIKNLIRITPELNQRKLHKGIAKTYRPSSEKRQFQRNKKTLTIKNDFGKNLLIIDSLKKQVSNLYDSLNYYQKVFQSSRSELLEHRNNINATLFIIYDLHQQLGSARKIENFQNHIVTYTRLTDSIESSDKLILKQTRYLTGLNEKVSKQVLSRSNRNLIAIKKIKTLNYQDEEEDKWFNENQQELSLFLEKNLPELYRHKKYAEDKIDWLYHYLEVLKTERKTLVRDSKIIKMWNVLLLKKEASRHNFYNRKAVEIISETKGWMKKTRKKG